MFKFDDLIRTTFSKFVHGKWENEVLVRELKILREIAKQHDLLPLYEKLYKKTRRKVVRTRAFSGFVVTRQSVMFAGDEVDMDNIYDASLACKFAYNAFNMLSVKEFLRVVKRSFKTIMNTRNYTVEKLPEIE
jgi:hypothetical protein